MGLPQDEFGREYRLRQAHVESAEQSMEQILVEAMRGAAATAAAPASRTAELAAGLVGSYDRRARAQVELQRLEQVAPRCGGGA